VSRHIRSVRTPVAAVGAAMALCLTATAFLGAAARGVDSGTFTVVSRADALSIGVIDPGAPVVPAGVLLDASPATAQATFDSLGQSSAFAALPFPGEFFATLPGTLNGLLAGQAPPFPPYPAYVTSSYPASPQNSQTQGPYGITATSSQSGSVGDAVVGLATGSPQAAEVHARAETAQKPDGLVVADALTDTEGLTLGTLVRIASITSHVRMTLLPGQKPKAESAIQFGTLTVGGMVVGLTDRGLEVAGSPKSPDTTVVTDLLAKAGIGLTLVPSVHTPTSIVSGGLRITTTNNVRNQGRVVTTIVLGRVSASLENASGLLAGLPDASGSLDLAPSDAPASAPGAAGGIAAGAGAAAQPGASTVGPQAGWGDSRRVQVTRPPLGPSGRGFYLVLVLAGLSALGASQVIRLLAVRNRR
jgi:hypothetical protein